VALAVLPLTSLAAQAQSGVVDEAKLPALMGGDFATATSQLALSKTSNGSIRAFAELEIAEQVAVAQAFGSESGAAGLSEEHATMVAQLEALEGPEFDMMYIDGQIAGHQELLGIHQTYARNGDDPMARGGSIVGVTGIQSHLAILQGLRQSLGA
jgi:putative membrane protein